MRVVKTLSPLTEPSTAVNFKSRASFIHHGFKSLNKMLCTNLRQPLLAIKTFLWYCGYGTLSNIASP